MDALAMRGSRGTGSLAWTPRRSKDDVQFMQRGQSISPATESHNRELHVGMFLVAEFAAEFMMRSNMTNGD